jgi:curved DNA-binding protein CbpA
MSSRGNNYYEVLGITPEFPTEAVEGLRRSFSKLYHPDAGTYPDSARMAAVNQACDVLGNRDLRANYDARLGGAFDGPTTRSAGPDSSRRRQSPSAAAPRSTPESRSLWEGSVTLVIGPASGPASVRLASRFSKPLSPLIGGGFGRSGSVGSVMRSQGASTVFIAMSPGALRFRETTLVKAGSRYTPEPIGPVIGELPLASITRGTRHRVGFDRNAMMLWTNEGDWCFSRGWKDLGPAVRERLEALGLVVVDGIDSWAVGGE